MGFEQVLQIVASILSIGMFAAAIVGVVLFAKYKGTISALQDTVKTYSDLNSAYQLERQELKEKMEEQDKRIGELEKMLAVERAAVGIAVAETTKVLKDFLVCPNCGANMGDPEGG